MIATPPELGLHLFYSSTDGLWVSHLPLYSDCRLIFFGKYNMTLCAVHWGEGGLRSLSHLLLLTKEIICDGDHGNWPAAYRRDGDALVDSVSELHRALAL